MKLLVNFLYFIIFLLAGEAVFRFNDATKIFDNLIKSRQIIDSTDALKMLCKGQINLDTSNLRIMVLGDSYIHGGGLPTKYNFSNRLKEYFRTSYFSEKHVYILDVSRPSNNNLDNYNTYFAFNSKFKPQIVIWGFCINDADGDLEEKINNSSLKQVSIPPKSKDKLNFTTNIYKILYNSTLLKRSLIAINGYLKSMGIIVPYTEYDNELKYYTLDKPQWRKSKKLINEVLEDIKKNETNLLVIRMPEMNLLEYPKIFEKTDSVIETIFHNDNNIKFINGQKVFAGKKSSDYMLVRYDPHSNAAGQDYLAKYIYNYIKENVIIKY